MEFRQLRFFVALAEELHFGRAAAREHIVQSALSQQICRLERELSVRLFSRSTHHVRLTPAGAAFLVDARQLLAHAERAAATARRAQAAPILRVGIADANCDSMPRILRDVTEHHPDLEVHQIEVGVPEQMRLIAQGRLDVGFGRASPAPPEVASGLVRLDPLGVLVADGHPWAGRDSVPVAMLDGEPLLLPGNSQAPEFDEFVTELCRSAGFVPALYRGTVGSVRAAADLVGRELCVSCTPSSCASALPAVVWRPLAEPAVRYPLSLLWRAGDRSEPVNAVVHSARNVARESGWLDEAPGDARRPRHRGKPFGDRRAS